MNRAIRARLYYPALLVALTLPDICVATTLDQSMSVKPKHYIEWIDKYTVESDLGLSGTDCYRIRCGVVHRGNFSGNPKFDYSHIIFTLPETKGGIHALSIAVKNKRAGMLDLVLFCNTMEQAARKWFQDYKSNPKVLANMHNLIRLCPNGILPFVAGFPVLASGE